MNRMQMEALRDFAARTGLKVDASATLFGVYDGYSVLLMPENQNNQLVFSVSLNGQEPDHKALKGLVQSSKAIAGRTTQRCKVYLSVRSALTAAARMDMLGNAMRDAADYFKQNGYVNACEQCGAEGETEGCHMEGAEKLLCENCYAALSEQADREQQRMSRQRENVLGGLVGALLGSLIGAAAIVLISRLGYVAAVSGIIMAVCTIKGYELLGGKISVKGILLSAAVMLGMIYAAHRFDFAIDVAQYFKVDVLEAFRAVPELLAENPEAAGTHWRNLAMLYVFSLLGAVPTVAGALKNSRQPVLSGKMAEKSA